jgi:uncharacterized protein involved in outer membrane biogenesis
MKYLRIVFSIVILLVVVLVSAAICLVILVDPNKLKPVLIEEVAKKTGYQLAIEGQLSWSFYPKPSIKIEHMVLSSPRQSQPLADLRDIKMTLSLMPLLRGEKTLRGDIDVADVKLMALRVQSAHIGVHWKKGTVSLQPMIASLYTGQLQGIAHGSNFTTVPHWDWDVQLSNIQLGLLLRDLSKDDKLTLSGIGQVTWRAATSGNTTQYMLQNLNGVSRFSVQNGVVEGIDLNYLLQTADALISKQPITVPTNINRTVFQQLTGSTTIQHGVAQIDSLSLVSPALMATGRGTFNLIERTIDLQLQITPQTNANIQWLVPVWMTGTLDRPTVRLDRLELEKFIIKRQLEKLKNKANDEIKKHIPGKAGEFLQRLLSQ